jgi:hypothetical protein
MKMAKNNPTKDALLKRINRKLANQDQKVRIIGGTAYMFTQGVRTAEVSSIYTLGTSLGVELTPATV